MGSGKSLMAGLPHAKQAAVATAECCGATDNRRRRCSAAAHAARSGAA